MNFAFTPEQDELRRTVRNFLDNFGTEAEVRRVMDTDAGFDADVWRRIAGDLGVAGLALPERYGGAGCGFVELGICLEEFGRALFCAPALSGVVLAASTLLLLGDDDACRAHLPGIADGTTVATLALTEASGTWDAAGVTATATRAGGTWWLDGAKAYVLDGCSAALLLVAAQTDAGVSVFAVDADAPGLRRTAQTTLDRTRHQAVIELAHTPAQLLGEDGRAWPVLERVLDLAAVAVAAEQAGGAARVRDMAVDYAKTRVQFGQPIGAFQAVKHKLADLHLAVESARSAAYHGLWAADHDPAALPEAANLAKACCGDAFVTAATENIQVHGGIGFTWEHSAHLYLKRAHATQQLFGNAAHHRRRLARRVLANAAPR
ncbi:acyl-CoA/acyl-ACP dehydrogenase [Yinghuangia sp. ASG 101]|uniref:acyl-CoA dehydrogenase family protein n=1 Tax=Yinghuangia sp. ASG 101 TaxID=2896848 RepID=UPI001E416DD2|nr:acyl-CoA dehydrogenase family protein [Yinghuangia sp. ASG 101]UGQ12517.1 acyl-CoA/acyl-ACP dehydrogenase [Yinghuangia sp. ASG 101]